MFIWYMFSKIKKSIIPFLFHACQRYFTPVGSELQWSPYLLKGFRTTLAFSKTVNTPNTWSRWNAQTIIRIHLLTSVFFQLGTYISFHPAENQKHCCCLRGRAINPQLLLQFKGCAGLCFLSIWKWKTINYDDGDGNGTPPQKMDLGGNGGTPRSGTPCSKKTKKQSWHILHFRREKIVSLHQKSLFDTILTFSFVGRVGANHHDHPQGGWGRQFTQLRATASYNWCCRRISLHSYDHHHHHHEYNDENHDYYAYYTPLHLLGCSPRHKTVPCSKVGN